MLATLFLFIRRHPFRTLVIVLGGRESDIQGATKIKNVLLLCMIFFEHHLKPPFFFFGDDSDFRLNESIV
jgi:hypothetical protein